jgi:hypothetical protein
MEIEQANTEIVILSKKFGLLEQIEHPLALSEGTQRDRVKPSPIFG